MSPGGRGEDLALAAWKPPLIVAAAAVAIVGGFYLGGPGLGMAVGALAAGAIVVIAARAVPRGPIVPAPLPGLRRHLLLVSRFPLEDPLTIDRIERLCASADPGAATTELRLLVPVSAGFCDRWSGERRSIRARAEGSCVHSLAALAKAGLTATAGLGDEDAVPAVEDELRTFPATDVVLLTAPGDPAGDEHAAAELRARLQTDFLHLEVPVEVGHGPRARAARVD